MSHVSALFVRKQIAQARSFKDPAPLYDLVRLTPDSVAQPDTMVPVGDYFDLVETIAAAEGPLSGFHMRVSASMTCEDFGALGLAMKSAPSLKDAFARIGRYTRHMNARSTFGVEDRGDVFAWTHRFPPLSRLGSQLANESALATFLTLFREAAGHRINPTRVQFSHMRPGAEASLAEHFGVAPVFGAASDEMLFDATEAERPFAIHDRAIWTFFLDHLDSTLLPSHSAEKSLDLQVMEEVTEMLSGGVPTLADVAANLGIGQRTLQRRLAEQDMNFQGLVDRARAQLARELVSQSRYPFTEIAFLTGFSEQSAFSRAFKRWTDQTPRAFRNAAQ